MKYLPADALSTRAAAEVGAELRHRGVMDSLALTNSRDETGLIPIKVIDLTSYETGAVLATIRIRAPHAQPDDFGKMPPEYTVEFHRKELPR